MTCRGGTPAPTTEIIDTLAEAIEAARPQWDECRVQETADCLAFAIAK